MNNDRPRFGAPESPLDRAIDRAVRDIMRVDPPAGLRRRVLARIEAPPRRSIFLPRFTAAAAALAILVLAVVLMRPAAPTPVEPTRTASQPEPAQPPAPVVSAPTEPPPAATPVRTASAQRPRGVRSERIRMPRVTDVFGGAPGVAATNLRDDPAAVTAAEPPAEPAGGGLAPITVRPLTIPGIAVEPLRIPTIGPPK